VPLYRDLLDSQSPKSRDVQHLDIEGPSSDGCHREHRFNRLRCEQLESTLRIANTRQDHSPDTRVEDPAHQVPVSGLADTPGAGPFTRTNGDVALGRHHGQEALKLGQWHGEIGITHETQLASRCQ
jgi:hypothetical protein